ncbi:MAG: VOC family protein [Alphaproteobacteria bacterium]|jgi:catechol 2,3-dioxygenase-like lactoylglutathione lyase family enzyme
MIKGLHHAAYRCRSSEETRAFYEDFLELKFAHALKINLTQTGRDAAVLHTFYEMGDGSFLAFFEEPGSDFDFKQQRDFDLHIALEVDADTLQRLFDKGQAAGVETRGVSDHHFIDSIYFRDPNGYVIELAAKKGEEAEDQAANARDILSDWTAQRHA